MNSKKYSTQRTFSCLRDRAKDVVENLRWSQYHTPDNLSLFLIGEVAEFGKFCQWTSFEQLQISKNFSCICEEIADIVKCVLYLINALNLESNIETLLVKKLDCENQIYTLNRSKKIQNYFVNGQSTDVQLIDIQRMVWESAHIRDFKKIHTPTNLALSIAIKSGEIATCYQNRVVQNTISSEKVFLALADILINIMLFCEYLAIDDLDRIIWDKFNKDEERYLNQSVKSDSTNLVNNYM